MLAPGGSRLISTTTQKTAATSISSMISIVGITTNRTMPMDDTIPIIQTIRMAVVLGPVRTAAVSVDRAECPVRTAAVSVDRAECPVRTVAVSVERAGCLVRTVAVSVDRAECLVRTAAVSVDRAECLVRTAAVSAGKAWAGVSAVVVWVVAVGEGSRLCVTALVLLTVAIF
jgi:hypothetical protein